MSNSKKRKCTKSQKRCTKKEIEKFSEVLADLIKNYGAFLEKLAFKKSSNNEVFEHI